MGWNMRDWESDSSGLALVVGEQTRVCLKVYAEDPSRVVQDANNERRIAHGGYATRQLEELVQNATDAARRGGGRVEVLLTDDTLYVANDGEPFDEAGVKSILASDISTKDDDRIGKFGIGFKSILAVSDSPRVFSRSVSFGFDREWAALTLKGEGYDVAHHPVMRLAQVLDPVVDGSSNDSHLADLMVWASTVIVAPLSVDVGPLATRLAQFAPEFVLFSPHLSEVRLRSMVTDGNGQPALVSGERRIVRENAQGGLVRVRAGADESLWSVEGRTIRPSEAALAEAGHVAARDSLEVQYAVRVPPANGLGSFWAYFPTQTKTTLSGIVNAPWKLSDDRLSLLEGEFNSELLEMLPPLVAAALERFSGTPDAVRVLEALPSRGGELGAREARNWVDRDINGPIFAHLRTQPILPDGEGRLRRPADLRWIGEIVKKRIGEDRRGPDLNAWLAAWSAVPGAPVDNWVHPEAYKNQEMAVKVSRLMGSDAGANDGSSKLNTWLEALVPDGSVAASAAAIELAARMMRDVQSSSDVALKAKLSEQIRAARIIRLEDGTFSPTARGKVFVRVEGQDRADVLFVDPVLANVEGVARNLKDLGVVLMDQSGELRKLLHEATQPSRRNKETLWPLIWSTIRSIPLEAAIQILKEDLGGPLTTTVHVKSAAAKWVPVVEAFLAGRLIPADGSRDRAFLIDPREHAQDDDLLKEIGAVDLPRSRAVSGVAEGRVEEWYADWESNAKSLFLKNTSTNIAADKVEVSAPSLVTWPLDQVRNMSDEAKHIVTSLLLNRGLPATIKIRHQTNSAYGTYNWIGPETHFLRRHGRFATSHGYRAPAGTLMAQDEIDGDAFPTVEVKEQAAKALGIRTSLDVLTVPEWEVLKRTVDGWRTSDHDKPRATFYAWLLFRGPVSEMNLEELVAAVGKQRHPVQVANVGVTSSAQTYDSMIDAAVPALLVHEDDVALFVEHLGMPRGEDLLQEEIVADPAGESVHLTDAFPPLKLRLEGQDQDLMLQPVSRLVRMTATPRGQIAKPLTARRDGDTVFVTADSAAGRLGQISQVLGLGLGATDIADVQRSMEKTASDKLRTQIKRCRDDDERLVLAVGVDALRRTVPAQALEVLDQANGGAPPREIAALARAVHGVAILKHLRHALDERGLEPPKEWAGRRITRQWVDGLGFPRDWAGFPGSQRAAVEMIDGPAVLSPLHDYQEFVTERIEALLRGAGQDRGMVSLPTGAGKTRVTVEALVKAVRDDLVSHDQPLVWIAQTDELCEQAAETWTYVWRALGPQVPMRLGRLWGSNEVSEEPGSFQLVIATISKLSEVRKRPGYDYAWLSDPSVVVIDEAHTSIATSYTQALDWMGRGRGRDKSVRHPLIGLTATPFRGNSEVETERLAGRYANNRLDRGAFRREDPYEELQDMGVLAQVRQKILDGVEVTLSDRDREEIKTKGWLPPAVTERLGTDLERTRRIVEHIALLPEDWTVLVFAPSVENARVLAALLAHRGVSAVSISADTEPAARRHYVDEFKAGRIRVLTNYNVLTQGFDAPKVQAVYVARPTFSPNVYQQMIGRGLRGPLNGGSEEVLIVNVEDNFDQYGDMLAFNEFEYLWAKK